MNLSSRAATQGRARRARRAVLVVLLLAGASGCAGFHTVRWVETQRWPEPMENLTNPLPPGEAALHPPGPEEVRVLRHADPVQVRTAGNAGSFPLSHRRKEIRVASGSGIACAAGGRAEILWPDGGSVVLFGRTAGIVGSLSRGEPSFLLRDLERAQFDPASEDLFELLGGAQLRARAGPVRVSRVRDDVLRVSNQSKRAAQLAYLDATIVLDPGQAVDVPLLASGGRPTAQPAVTGVLEAGGFTAEREGEAGLVADGAEIVARGPGVVRALGISVRLEDGLEARFSGLTTAGRGPAPPAEPAKIPPPTNEPAKIPPPPNPENAEDPANSQEIGERP